ncbi:hypothetical protein F4859DRAFT_514297 [Xylaria cf. heliscus]|nr:hypothetical protein F4859DRAFT_514297 [Xylaria cf. heliscus]
MFTASDTGEIISTYPGPENDQTYCIHYPLLSKISVPQGIPVARQDELEELGRLGPDADLVSYPPPSILIQVVDLLNLRCGIVHQDIASRNLPVDDSTDSIKPFDFNFAARTGLFFTAGGRELR